MNLQPDYEHLQTIAYQAGQLRYLALVNNQHQQALQALGAKLQADAEAHAAQVKALQQRLDDMAARLNSPRFTDGSDHPAVPCAQEACGHSPVLQSQEVWP